MESGRFVSLNHIISYTYIKKKGIKKIDYEEDLKYRNFLKECKNYIKKLCEALDIDIQLYKVDDNRYEIPYLLGEILKIYLLQDSKKGSIISKIKAKSYDKITYEEKVNFIDEVTELLKKEHSNDEITPIVEWLKKKWKVQGKINKDIKELAEDTKIVVNNFIDTLVTKITGITDIDGLVSLTQYRIRELEETDDNISMGEFIEKIKYNRIPHKESLTFDDKVILIDYLKYWILDNMKDFLYIVEDFSQIREVDSSEHSPKDYQDSKVLLKESINEYRDMIKEQLMPKKLPPNNEDEIMKEIKKLLLKE